MRAIDVFMRRILDYAGLFPPANLSLDEALDEFQSYHRHPRSQFLGRFIMPLDRLDDVNLANSSMRFSGLLRVNTLTMTDACAKIEQSAAALRAFALRFPRIITDSIEVDLPAEAWIADGGYRCFRDFLDLCEQSFERKIFVELDWRKPYAPVMAIISERRPRSGLKLRTGGVTPDSIPPSRAIARFLLAAAHHKLPMKATAGLHVPVPNENPEVGSRLHGFLNVFCGGFLAITGRGDEQAITDVLDRFTYADFAFSENSMRCGSVEFSIDEIEQLRCNWLLSFGSCSFLEPIGHLERHGLI